MLALIPGTTLMVWWLGPGVLINLCVLILGAMFFEAVVLTLRKRSVAVPLTDGSIVLAAWLLALCLPPSLPVSQLIVGAGVMTLLGKHVYGGLGQNPFNPAMVAYAFLLISFPQTMTLWLDPKSTLHIGDNAHWLNWWYAKWPMGDVGSPWHGITQATPLDRLRNAANQSAPLDATLLLQSPWWKINLAWLLGGIFLLYKGVIRWHIPAAMLLTIVTLQFIHNGWNPSQATPIWMVITSGGILLGAFFIATDPVTAPSSRQARLCFGVGIGTLTFVLRNHSHYPEGVAFAVLLMNATVPLLDRLFRTDKQL